MSVIVNKRKLAESVQTVVKASVVQPGHLEAVFQSLAQIVTDVTGQECELVLRFKSAATQTTEGAGQ